MIDAITYQRMLEKLEESNMSEGIVGFLFTRPDLVTGKSIMGSLSYYHHATRENIDFFLPGYGAYWPLDLYEDKIEVTQIEHIRWLFSSKAFTDFAYEFEDMTGWEYSGESELLLIPYDDGKLDFSDRMSFLIDQMIKDNVISSISSFFTHIARVARKQGFSSGANYKNTMQKYIR